MIHTNGTCTAARVIAEQLGMRLKQARLNCDLTQTEVAKMAWISRKSVMKAETGNVTLENLITILQALDLAEQLDLFLPSQPFSPIKLLKLKEKKRQHASGNNGLTKQKQKLLKED